MKPLNGSRLIFFYWLVIGPEEHSNSWDKCWNVTFSCWSSVLLVLRLGSVHVPCPFSHLIYRPFSSENEFLRIQPWPTSKTYSSVSSSLLLQAAHVQAEIIQPWATWSRHMEQHSLEESTWSNEYLGLSRGERCRRRSACSEFGKFPFS